MMKLLSTFIFLSLFFSFSLTFFFFFISTQITRNMVMVRGSLIGAIIGMLAALCYTVVNTSANDITPRRTFFFFNEYFSSFALPLLSNPRTDHHSFLPFSRSLLAYIYVFIRIYVYVQTQIIFRIESIREERFKAAISNLLSDRCKSWGFQ